MDLCTECFPPPPNSGVQEEASPPESLNIPNNEELREPLDGNSNYSPEFRVFHNPLLFDEISKYLDHSDLKSLSETGKLLLNPSRNSSQFVQKTQLNIDEKSSTRDLDVLKSEFIPWTTVKLHVRKYEAHVYEVIQQVLSTPSIKSLQLEQTDSDDESFYVSTDDCVQASDDDCFHEFDKPSEIRNLNVRIVQLLLSMQNLKSLKLNVELLARVENLFDSPKLQLFSSSLDTLHIYVPSQISYLWSKALRDLSVQGGTPYRAFSHNMESLATLMSGKRLRSFSFQLSTDHFNAISLIRVPSDEPIPYLKAVADLVAQHQASLEELSLHGQVWSCSELRTVRCPNLISLEGDTTDRESDYKNIAAFIENQPLLVSLTLRLTWKILNKSKLIEIIRRKSTNLERLHICWNLVQDSELREQFDWTFLQGLTRLKDLSIYQSQPTRSRRVKRGSVPQLVAHLPISLQKLQILSEPRALRISDPESLLVTRNLAKLRNLSLLDLTYAPNSITDAGLQFICYKMTQLSILRINQCKALTDFGITGKRGNHEDTGISLASLTRLQELEVVNCKNIKFSSLLTVLEFKELKRLDICVPMSLQDVKTPCAQILRIATQNPCLEEMRLGRHRSKHARRLRLRSYSNERMKAHIQKFRPRFKDLEIYG